MSALLAAFASLGVVAFLVVLAFTISVWRDRRKREKLREQQRELCRHLFANRPKARIVRVGTIRHVGTNENGPMIFLENGWAFDNSIRVPLSAHLFDGERDRELFLGWTREELMEAAQRPAEFVSVEVET